MPKASGFSTLNVCTKVPYHIPKYRILYAKFDVLTAVTMNIVAFCYVTPRLLVETEIS
jgi:hypothetical protein